MNINLRDVETLVLGLGQDQIVIKNINVSYILKHIYVGGNFVENIQLQIFSLMLWILICMVHIIKSKIVNMLI